MRIDFIIKEVETYTDECAYEYKYPKTGNKDVAD
jgi:hypothetical protein